MVKTKTPLDQHVEAALELCEQLAARFRVATKVERQQIIRRVSETASGTPIRTFEQYLSERLGPLMADEFNLRDPKYIGHMNGPIDPMLVSLAMVITFLNPNLVKTETARVVTEIERQRIAEWHDLIFGRGGDHDPI